MSQGAAATAEQLVDLRRANSAKCASAILSIGAATIAEIAVESGLSRPTVTARLLDLQAAGLVRELAAEAPRGAGRPASRFTFVPDAMVVAGLELGKHVERLILTDLVGHELWHGQRDVTLSKADERLSDAAAWVATIAEGLGRRLGRVGVAVPGSMDPAGVFVESAAFEEWRGRAVPPIVKGAFSVPVDVLHDVASAMHAEQRMGAAVEVDTFVLPVLWHRVSAGIVVSGRVHGGHSGRSGNLHQRADLLDAASADDLEWPSDPEVTSMVRAEAEGDTAAATSLDRFSDLAAEQIAMLQLVIDPEIIVLHGPLAGHESLVERVTARLNEIVPGSAPVVISDFGQYGTVIGAVLSALDGASDDLIGPGMAPYILDRSRLSEAIGGRAPVLG
ncbi:ROK family transcriptional regulator [Microbacterium sp. 1.5R]|uniref:ROK family transcriptional regulator n=1 Tax=Microbacterium sp. 1.5R TaxID=1916917 RepID=UPI00164279D8|nr:ROK family transcriptional regulator [Microbacterium sp. 1.5R]